jgi:hypothetical protein
MKERIKREMREKPGPNHIKLLGAYLGTYLSQINWVRRLNKRLKVL